MGGYISIGLGYNQTTKNEYIELPNLLEYLYSLGFKGGILKFSLDEDGENWVEKSICNIINVNEFSSLLLDNFYGELNGKIDIFGATNVLIRISVEREEDSFGFLLEIEEEAILGSYDELYLQNTTNEIIAFLKGAYNHINYDYVFCDHEGEFQFPLGEVINSNQLYSILVIPSKGDFLVKLSSWHINGVSDRN
jgi:hypothetical protein